ncbi:hypothetical protein E2C01_077476 [Portunus trituberculatus]|uniref:Uncharacterized protein n=1 Tax=Portunus trituberculatus TaxID=210409 RepID=A0A5B7IKC1_PORTR|nr:hypothetical protein [Portunus trituberculatus]
MLPLYLRPPHCTPQHHAPHRTTTNIHHRTVILTQHSTPYYHCNTQHHTPLIFNTTPPSHHMTTPHTMHAALPL